MIFPVPLELGEIIERVRAFAEAGADAVAIRFGALDGFAERMSRFAARQQAVTSGPATEAGGPESNR
ncbi:hypothetical protein [Saccharopolyspora spinosa]|uniref:hypothetical protein n=1 Tax=Saccharopolyspora spinosa TaxID=60894 RepID=UPI000237B6B9|nr:hypothetical protein [Saccharopolyspora spinosa]